MEQLPVYNAPRPIPIKFLGGYSATVVTYILEQRFSMIIKHSDDLPNPMRKLGFLHFKGHSHYCVFCVRLWQTVAFPQEIKKFLSLRWRSPLRKTQTSASSVNQPLSWQKNLPELVVLDHTSKLHTWCNSMLDVRFQDREHTWSTEGISQRFYCVNYHKSWLYLLFLNVSGLCWRVASWVEDPWALATPQLQLRWKVGFKKNENGSLGPTDPEAIHISASH